MAFVKCQTSAVMMFTYVAVVWMLNIMLTIHGADGGKHGESCNVISVCRSDLICNNNNKCDCSDTQYYDSTTDKCYQKISHGQNCDSTKVCQADLTCNSNTKLCGCRDTEYYDPSNPTDMCKTKLSYNSPCDIISSPDNVCMDQNTVCTTYTSDKKYCLCDNTSYRTDGGTCNSKNNLMVKDTQQTRSTHGIGFIWRDTSNRGNISYTITWNGGSVPTTITGVNVTGLTPGTVYNFVVISTLPRDDNYLSITVQQTFNPNWTYPAKPGSVTQQELTSDSPVKPFRYDISFGRPEGNVDHCSVIISGGGTGSCNSNTIIPTTSLDVSCTLDPAQQYNYTLKCYNGNSPPDESEPATGSFNTQPAGSGQVQNLRTTEVQEYSANITWQNPTDPNGNIVGFLVQVRQQVNGECAYNIKVPCQGSFAGCVQQQVLNVTDGSCSKTETEEVSYNNGYNLKLSRLEPYHNYTIIVRAINENGPGLPKTINLTTNIGAAKNVKSVSSNSVTDGNSHQVSLTISWTPDEYTGSTTYYILVQEESGLGTNVYNESSSYTVGDYYTTTYVVDNVLAYWNYQISVMAGTNKGNSSWTVTQNRTASNRPGVVQNLRVVQDDTVAKKLIITFDCPEEQNRNGTINKFMIRQTLQSPGNSNVINYTVSYEASKACKSSYSYPVTDVLVQQNYSFSILTVNDYSEGEFGTPENKYIHARAPRLAESMATVGVNNLVKESDTEETKITVAVCAKCLLDGNQGGVTNVGLLVCVKGQSCTESGRKKRAAMTNYTQYTTWGQAKISDFRVAYRTTPDDWIDTLRGGNDIYTFVIGGNTSCSSASVYCNGPLREGTEYKIKAIACTVAGCDVYGDDQVFVTRRSEGRSVGAIVGGVLGGVLSGLILVAFVCIICIIWRRKTANSRESIPEQRGNSGIANNNSDGRPYTTTENISLPELGEDTHVYAEPSDYDYIGIESFQTQEHSHSPKRVYHEHLSMEDAKDNLFPYENEITMNDGHENENWK